MSIVVAFVISSKIQWQNFIVIAPTLTKLGYSVHFISMYKYDCPFEKTKQFNENVNIQHTILNKPIINALLYSVFNRRFLRRFLPLFSLKISWCYWLKQNNPNVVIFGVDHSIINSYMIYVCNKRNIKNAVLQDAYMPLTWWRGKYLKRALDFINNYFNIYIPHVPNSFNSGTLFAGVIGDECKVFLQKYLFNHVNIITVGSPRLDGIANNKENLVNNFDKNIFKIVFILSNLHHKSEIEDQQQQTLLWLCKVVKKLDNSKNAFIQVVLHPNMYNIDEYRILEKSYEGIIKLNKSEMFLPLICNSDICLTYSSTGIIECMYIEGNVGIITSPLIEKPLNRAVLHFDIQHINSENKLIDMILGDSSYYISSHNTRMQQKVANFTLGWNSIDKTARWISSLIS